ncbi:hypothetical protein K438DRAFT_1749067 [Mycena galopus ATCC 62051]|nr:hypothetical protein K438DRAFT_1749067 [Mycena galopus ATCC 62051]
MGGWIQATFRAFNKPLALFNVQELWRFVDVQITDVAEAWKLEVTSTFLNQYLKTFTLKANLLVAFSGKSLMLIIPQLTNGANTCLKAALVTSGYSQGGQMVHKAQDAFCECCISYQSYFGDPDDREPVSGVHAANTDVIRHVGKSVSWWDFEMEQYSDSYIPGHTEWTPWLPRSSHLKFKHKEGKAAPRSEINLQGFTLSL